MHTVQEQYCAIVLVLSWQRAHGTSVILLSPLYNVAIARSSSRVNNIRTLQVSSFNMQHYFLWSVVLYALVGWCEGYEWLPVAVTSSVNPAPRRDAALVAVPNTKVGFTAVMLPPGLSTIGPTQLPLCAVTLPRCVQLGCVFVRWAQR